LSSVTPLNCWFELEWHKSDHVENIWYFE